jgi:hypothetical protein
MLESLLRHLEPFCGLDRDALSTVARHARVARIAAGRRVTRSTAAADAVCYLLDGTVALDGREPVRATSPRARRPLVGGDAGAMFAITLESSRVLWVSVASIDFLLDSRRPAGVDVRWLGEPGGEGDEGWQERLLRRGLASGAPVVLQRLFAALEPVDCEARAFVLREGECGSDYFVVARGRVELTRRDGFRRVLTAGDAFGEDAILGDGRRNASAFMPEGGRLMRLSEAEFRSRLLPALIAAAPTRLLPIDATVVDLDAKPWRDVDARTWTERRMSDRGDVPLVAVVGGTRDARLRWAYFAARLGRVVLPLD